MVAGRLRRVAGHHGPGLRGETRPLGSRRTAGHFGVSRALGRPHPSAEPATTPVINRRYAGCGRVSSSVRRYRWHRARLRELFWRTTARTRASRDGTRAATSAMIADISTSPTRGPAASPFGHHFPPGVPPTLLSAYRPSSALADPRRTHDAGFTRSTRVRPGPGRALSLPRGLRCSPTTDGPWPSPAASQRLVPFIPALPPNPGSRVTRHQQEFPVSRPMPVLPLACNRHGWGSGP